MAMRPFSRFDSRTFLFLLLAAGLAVCVTAFADTGSPLLIQQVAGGGLIVTSNNVYPRPLVARVTDVEGNPVSGVEVHFEAPHCHFDGTFCFVDIAYPYFPAHANEAVAISDSNGLASSPQIRAGNQAEVGDDPSTYFEFVASIRNNLPTGLAIEKTTFMILQADSLNAIPITSGYTGSWYDPEQNGHGLTVEVLPGNRIVVNWNTFTPDGAQQAWFGGVGEILSNQAVVYAYQPGGGRWIPHFDSSMILNRLWGTLTLTFSDCGHGRVDFAGDGGFGSVWGSDHMDLTRLTLPAGLSCP
jgi:hypothetical protein